MVCDSSWEGLVERCPGLEVQLHVEQVVNTDRLGRVLLPQVPLTDYSMTSCYFTESDWSAKPLLSEMLPQYWDRLQVTGGGGRDGGLGQGMGVGWREREGCW